jgi:hypothetical protein
MGLAGGPRMLKTPGPLGIRSPNLTSAMPSTVNPVDAPMEPIGSTYGTPLNELTIWQSDPVTAKGIPLAVTVVCSIVVITPESGGPAAPGDNTTAQPTETGGLDTFTVSDITWNFHQSHPIH